MSEPAPSYFNHQSVTIFPKSVNKLTLASTKPIQPGCIPITNINIKNTNTFVPR